MPETRFKELATLSEAWLNHVDVVKPLLFSLNRRAREVVELRLRGSATVTSLYIKVCSLKQKWLLVKGKIFVISSDF